MIYRGTCTAKKQNLKTFYPSLKSYWSFNHSKVSVNIPFGLNKCSSISVLDSSIHFLSRYYYLLWSITEAIFIRCQYLYIVKFLNDGKDNTRKSSSNAFFITLFFKFIESEARYIEKWKYSFPTPSCSSESKINLQHKSHREGNKVGGNEQYFALRRGRIFKLLCSFFTIINGLQPIRSKIGELKISSRFIFHPDLQSAIITSNSNIIISYVFACYNLSLELSLLEVVIQRA